MAEPQIDIDIDLPNPGEDTECHELGRYLLCGEIASGGMATVHLAVARGPGGFGKILAVKRIHPHLAKEKQFVDMFLDEARIASRIDHPHVCSVLDVGHDGRCHYLVMEYLLGEPLRAVLQRLRPFRRTDPEAVTLFVTRIVADICEGLHAAHEVQSADGRRLDVVHRDVSPQNLFISYDGAPKLVDFGIAHAADRIHQSEVGAIKGKLAYMAPEQVHGDEVDRRADVWALGVVLWESLTGRPLFRRRHGKETLLAVTHAEVPSIREFAPRAPTELDDVVRRALQPDPKDRFPTARAMGRALRTWLAMQERPADAAVVSAWMRRLFPGELDAKRQRLQHALMHATTQSDATHESRAHEGRTRSRIVRRPSRSNPSRSKSSRRARRALQLATAALVLATGGWTLARTGAVPGGPGSPGGPDSGLAPVAAPPAALGPRRTAADSPDPSPRAAEAPPPSPLRAGAIGSRATTGPTAAGAGAAGAGAIGSRATTGPAAADRLAPDPEQPGHPPSRARDRSTRRALPTAGGSRHHARAPRAAVASPARASGRVQIAARGGWADVYLGRRHLGPTPGRFTLPVGQHVLTLRPEQGESQQARVRIRAGEVTRVTVDLEP